jgi:stage IV sporulation protein FB
VPIRFHFTFVLLLIFLLVTGLGSKESGAFYVVYIIALFASVLAHELGHAVVGRRYGVRTVEIMMFPIGGVSRLERQPKPQEELWIALAGPLVNLLIGGVLLGILAVQNKIVDLKTLTEPTDANLLERIAAGNLILAAFNLLPAFPMDGGRVLRALLSRFRSEEEATRMASWMGRMMAIGLGLYGLLSMHFMLVFIAFFVYLGAAQEGAAAMGRFLTHGIPVRAAMVTEYHTLSHGNTVRDAANLLVSTSQQDFPVVHAGRVIGLLGRNRLLRAMAAEGPDAYVAGVMDREFPTLSPDMDLAEALPLMAQAGSCALVMQGDNLLGLLTSENLSQFLLLRRFGMEPARV